MGSCFFVVVDSLVWFNGSDFMCGVERKFRNLIRSLCVRIDMLLLIYAIYMRFYAPRCRLHTRGFSFIIPATV